MIRLTNIILIITSVFLGFGFIAKNRDWPGGSVGLFLGSICSVFGILLYLIARYKKKEAVKTITYSVYFYFFTMCIGVSFFKKTHNYLSAFMVVEHNLKQSNDKIKESIFALSTSLEVLEFSKSTTALNILIEQHKEFLITETGGLDNQGIPIGKEDINIPYEYFVLKDNGNLGKDLKLKLIEHQNDCVALLGDMNSLIGKVSYEDYITSGGYNNTWQDGLVDHLPLALVLTNLTLIQNRVLHMNLTVASLLNRK